MSSSFVRKAPAVRDPGTRPGLHGQTLLSMGLVDLDRLLGGGLPLGSLLLVLEDPHSQQHLNFMRYFLAEGAACGHRLQWHRPPGLPSPPPHQFLPQLVTPGAASASAAAPTAGGSGHSASTSTSSAATAGAPSTSGDAAGGGGNDDGLRIAWQYRKYLAQKERQEALSSSRGGGGGSGPGRPSSGSSSFRRTGAAAGGGGGGGSASSAAVEAGIGREWCHQFDLTRPMGQAALEGGGLVSTLLLERLRTARVLHKAQPVLLQANHQHCSPFFCTAWLTESFETPLSCTLSLLPHSPIPLFQVIVDSNVGDRGGGLEPLEAASAAACTFVDSFRPPSNPPPKLPLSSAAPSGSPASAPAAPLPLPSMLPKGPETVGRLVFQSLGHPCWQQQAVADCDSPAPDAAAAAAAAATAVLRCVFRLHRALRDSRCAALVTCPAAFFPPSFAQRLQHACDAVLALQPLADDSDVFRLLPDPSTACALLHVRKLPAAGMVAPRLVPEPQLLVVRSKRKRLAVTPIEVCPDAVEKAAESQAAAQQGTGAAAAASSAVNTKSAASLLCGGPSQSKKTLDF